MYEHLKENGDLVRPSDSAPKKDMKHGEIDIKAIEQKRQHAEITRNRIEVGEFASFANFVIFFVVIAPCLSPIF